MYCMTCRPVDIDIEECTDDIDDLGEDGEPMDKCIPSLRIIVTMTVFV